MKKKIIDRLVFIKSHWCSFLAFIILTFMMTMGFLTTYATIWLTIGLPTSNAVMVILAVLAFVSEWLYLWWVAKVIK